MDHIATFEAKIDEYQKRGLTHAMATREIVVKHPDLHRAYLVAFNAQHGRTI